MFEIIDFYVEVGLKEILKGVFFIILDGEMYILFGLNGSGKIIFMMSIMGFLKYKIMLGKIIFNGIDIIYMLMYERVKFGIGMMF